MCEGDESGREKRHGECIGNSGYKLSLKTVF